MSANVEPAIRESVRVPMRDGVELSVHIYRPATNEPVPAVMQYSPYRKGPIGRPHPIVEHGYAVVAYDVRGTGDSCGFTTDIYSDAERQDGYDMVEWIAKQPWCNGNVGMWGISYGAVVSLQIAMQAPPHLKAIIVRSGTDDVFTEWTNPGGSPRPYMYENYATLMTAYNFAPPHPEECGERWAEIWQEHLEKNVPWGLGFISHLGDGPYWRDRSLRDKYDRIQCPVFVVGGWADWYYTPLLRTFMNVDVPKRALIGPWSHLWPEHAIPGPRIDGLRECLKWFGQWLKGVDTGVMDEPPVTVFVREHVEPSTIIMEDRGEFRCESEWPPARAIETPMYLQVGGRLASGPCNAPAPDGDAHEYRAAAIGVAAGMHGGGPFAPSWTMPLDQRADEAYSLAYTTDPLESDVEVMGQPKAILHVSSTADLTMFVVKLCDVAPDGTSALVTKGYLNATHRESHCEPSPLKPGKTYELEIELLACAYRFRAGHRIRVDIASSDFQNVWPTPKSCVNTVYRDADHPSRILLQVVPARDPELPKPDLEPSPHPLPARESLSAPEYSVTRDLINETATVRFRAPFGTGSNSAKFTVSSRNPARATVEADAKIAYQQLGKTIHVEARCLTESDEKAFHHVVDLEIRVNDARHFHKSWAVSVPRGFV